MVVSSTAKAYKEEDSNLAFNAKKTKKFIVDFRKTKDSTHNPIHINGMQVERVVSFKVLHFIVLEKLCNEIKVESNLI